MIETDVLIIGSGIAGCAAALEAAALGLNVALITKAKNPKESNTNEAQGGIAVLGRDDTPELFARDIAEAGAGICKPEAVEILVQDGPRAVQEILIDQAKVQFSRGGKGRLDFTEEAAHSIRRILHVDDATGAAVEKALLNILGRHKAIMILQEHMAVDILTAEHHTDDPQAIYHKPLCLGAYVLDMKTNQIKTVKARATILATGGCGQVYLHTTNPRGATGDGYAMAYRAGARLINMEFTQFHPTTLFHRDANRFLISESVRGEGGVLKNKDGEPFMKRYHPLESLAPRDVVARAIHEEMLRTGAECMYLDLASYMHPQDIRRRFPTIYQRCKEFDINIARKPIPVVPAFHFQCGGIRVNLHGQTSIMNLYSAGETSCTGIHGANRLASTSMLEGLVWGRRSVQHIYSNWGSLKPEKEYNIRDWKDTGLETTDPALIAQDWLTIKNIMWNYVGLIRSRKRLQRAINDFRNLQDEVEEFYRNHRVTRELTELRNGLQSGLVITYSAWQNNGSLGCHYRID